MGSEVRQMLYASILFKVYLEKLTEDVLEDVEGVIIGEIRLKTTKCADDLTVMAKRKMN